MSSLFSFFLPLCRSSFSCGALSITDYCRVKKEKAVRVSKACLLACLHTTHIYLPCKGLKSSTNIRIPCRKAFVVLSGHDPEEIATSQIHSSNLSSVILPASSPCPSSLFTAQYQRKAITGSQTEARNGGRPTNQSTGCAARGGRPLVSQVHGERVERGEREKRRARLSAFTSAVKSKDFYTQRLLQEK